jgi:hypothetical protein
MPEITIKYKKEKTLQALMDFSKYFDFVITTPKKASKKKILDANGVKIIAGDSSIDTSGLNEIFTNSNLDAKQLRNKAWQRKK